MRRPRVILSDIRANRKDEDPEKMDFLMKTIKAVHSSATNPSAVTAEELEKQRANVDTFSRLVTPVKVVTEESVMIEGINCEWVRPSFAHRTDKIILYCHGGGYISGGLGYARILAAKLASITGYEVVSFEYRLSPENRFPAAIEDATVVWNHLMYLGYGAGDVIVAGDSAGGNLALEMCFGLREQNRLMPRALILFSPWTDMTCTNNSYKTYKDKDPLLTMEYIMSARNAYAGADADFEADCYSPLYGNLSHMPPTLIQVGSNEILRDDSERMAKRYNKCGSYAKLEVYSGGWHVFQQMPIHKASEALTNVKIFLDEVIR